MIKKITISVPLEKITPSFSEDLSAVLNKTKGKQSVEFLVYDKEKNMSLQMFSRSKKTKVNKKLISKLQELNDIEINLS